MRTDAQLIEQARRDADAFGELYERYARHLHAWFRQRVDPATAVDLTAETFAQAACSLRRFRDEAGGSAAPWLYGIARNLLRGYHERRRVDDSARRKLGLPLVTYAPFDEADERLDAEAAAPAVHSAVETLSLGQRKALQLRVVDGLSYAEVASSLGTSELAARLRVMRALGSLAEKLKGAAL